MCSRPIVFIAARKNHIGNAPRLIFMVIDGAVSAIPISIEKGVEVDFTATWLNSRSYLIQKAISEWRVSGRKRYRHPQHASGNFEKSMDFESR